MAADAPDTPDDSRTIQWRRDASTSRAVWLLWSLGVGTFFAAISIVVFWRLYDLAGQAGSGVQSIVVAFVVALFVTVLAVLLSNNAESQLERIARLLSITPPSGTALERATDAALGTIVMTLVIGSLMVAGRIVSQQGLLGDVGAGPFTGAAALLIPLALVAVALASFLRSAGALDLDDGALYLVDPDQKVDLSTIETVSRRRIADATVVTLGYAQPDGRYVPGPRRLVVPPDVAREIERAVDARP
ncbi:hypothetical protein EA462_00310 [Natrarchaeobius halalkaliphilus]|uniref:Uncharacterized protein n=1 Tax=Natrarchaeobius halalkaliphilus TaxID=1679091 RepID=A0A3N6LS64_9EURY|nr:hypothetical protein [Natrarchaeobius halalkaliphilus]RQG92713.1 hypothetical protein EA462_00310 [Natrarchaeobius halalkaliphilus]